ncbi:unnamed protein product [Rhodiola kirilowii]
MSNLAQDVSELKRDQGRLSSQSVPNPRGNIIMMEVVDVDAALKESTYWVNKTLMTEVGSSKNESKSVPIAFEGDVSSTLMSKENAPLMSKPDAPLMCEANAIRTVACSETHVFPSFSMQVIAPEGHMIDKDELGGRLEARHEQHDQTMKHPLDTSHEAPLEKSKDPGAFTVTCGIGETQIHHCLIDLGAAVNAMPYSLYCPLKLGPLKLPKLLIELGDKSCIRHVGLLEDLTLRVGNLVVPADFYVLQMGDARNNDPPALILGRPFLFTTKTKIDMGMGLLSLAFGGKISDFYIYGDDDRPCTKKPPDIVITSYLGALVHDLPDEMMHETRPAAMVKVSSRIRENVKGADALHASACLYHAFEWSPTGWECGLAEQSCDRTKISCDGSSSCERMRRLCERTLLGIRPHAGTQGHCVNARQFHVTGQFCANAQGEMCECTGPQHSTIRERRTGHAIA